MGKRTFYHSKTGAEDGHEAHVLRRDRRGRVLGP
jgi:hypothetical protein